MSKATKKSTESLPPETEQRVEAWFLRHFGHITPGTSDHAVAVAAKRDLLATLQPSDRPSAPEEPAA